MLISTIISVDAVAKPSINRACCQWISGSSKVLPYIFKVKLPILCRNFARYYFRPRRYGPQLIFRKNRARNLGLFSYNPKPVPCINFHQQNLGAIPHILENHSTSSIVTISPVFLIIFCLSFSASAATL